MNVLKASLDIHWPAVQRNARNKKKNNNKSMLQRIRYYSTKWSDRYFLSSEHTKNKVYPEHQRQLSQRNFFNRNNKALYFVHVEWLMKMSLVNFLTWNDRAKKKKRETEMGVSSSCVGVRWIGLIAINNRKSWRKVAINSFNLASNHVKRW